jgi:uncharacterized membrane protein YiaA
MVRFVLVMRPFRAHPRHDAAALPGTSKTTKQGTIVMHRPTPAFIGASWAALGAGALTFVISLWRAHMPLNEKGFYLTVLIFGLFAVVSLQKAVRDRLEGIPVTAIYYGLAWVATGFCMILLAVGLWNADLVPSEKGLYGMAFALALFGAVAVQKNIRDVESFDSPASA